MSEHLKVAVVTPYYKERDELLRRCLESVQAQTHPHVTHYMVADGFPRHDLLAEWPRVRHLPLPNGHANFGNTPRGIGALCALADGMDFVCFLDADNLFLPDHAASVVQAWAQANAAGHALDAVFSSRYMFLPGHEHLRLVSPDDGPQLGFVDTNCISLARSAAFMWGAWCNIPPPLASLCDRVMCWLMQHHRLRVSWTNQFTVLYESNWKATYLQAGLEPPSTGLHDSALSQAGQGLTEEELWSLLRVRWTFEGLGAPQPPKAAS